MSKRTASPVNRHGKHQLVECPKCGISVRSDNLPRHLATHNEKHLPCKYCKKNIREDLLPRHLATHNEKIPCRYCKKDIRKDKLKKARDPLQRQCG